MLNNFIYVKKKSLFTKELEAGNVLDEAIVFIEDTKEIWNHGTYFDCNTFDPSEIENTLSNKVDKVEGKQLSTEDFTTDLKTRLEDTPFVPGTGIDSAIQKGSDARGCEAAGNYSLAGGIFAKATGLSSVALGRYCSATGRAAMAFGGVLDAVYLTGGPNSLVYTTQIPNRYNNLINGLKLVSIETTNGNNNIQATIQSTEIGLEGLVVTLDRTFSENEVVNLKVGLQGTVAKGNNSFAEGSSYATVGLDSHAEGYKTIGAGDYSHAEGYACISNGGSSHAEGRYTTSSGNSSHSEGIFGIASGKYSHAEGQGGVAIHITGKDNVYRITKGSNILNFNEVVNLKGLLLGDSVNNFYATIIDSRILEDGYTVEISTDNDLGELNNVSYNVLLGASGLASHSLNCGIALGDYSHAGGEFSMSEGYSSFAHGYMSYAKGKTSTAFGTNNYAQNQAETALGISNHSHTGETPAEQTLFSVGCGDWLELSMDARIEQQIPLPTPEDGKNAIEIMRNGDIYLGGYGDGIQLYNAEENKVNENLFSVDLSEYIKKSELEDTDDLNLPNDYIPSVYPEKTGSGEFSELSAGESLSNAVKKLDQNLVTLVEETIKNEMVNASGLTLLNENKADKTSLSKVATTGSYNDLLDAPAEVTKTTVEGWGFTKNAGTYSKPSGGIPKTDLASSIQTTLTNADTAYGWGNHASAGYTKNVGTITGVSANGTSIATSGVANIPAASTSAYGVTKLSSSTSSTSTSLAATASAVKSAYDLANGRQEKLVSGTNIKTINGQSILGSGDISISGGASSGSGAYQLVNHGTSDTTFTLTPNTFHVWDEVTELNLDFGTETEGIANEYLFQFTSGATTTLSLPSDLKWANDAPPTISENMIYQVSILNGLASVLEFSNAQNVVLITFYFLGSTLQAEEGMTWEEWCDSIYNDSMLNITGGTLKLNGIYQVCNSSGMLVYGTDVIIENEYYALYQSGGGA